MARVTLIRPPVVELVGNLSYYRAVPPIGLAYVAAALQRAGHLLQIIDAPGDAPRQYVRRESAVGVLLHNGLSVEEIVSRIRSDVEVIGITHMFLHEWPTIRELCARIKERLPDSTIVLGGENATAFWQTIFREAPAVDFCLMGEGEQTVVQLVKALEAGEGASDIPGVMSREGSAKNRTRSPRALTSPRTTNPDTLPWPAWDLFPLESYFREGDSWGVERGRSMPILATRGCPFSCTFCSSPAMWTTKYKLREAADVVAEMVHYVDRYRVQNFNFCDLTAIIDREWILDLCQRLRASGRRITWQFPSGTRAEALDREVLEAIHAAGGRNITYAPESGSPRLLKIIKKKVKLPRMLDSLRAAHDAGLVTCVNVLLGFPDETRDDVLQTLRFVIQCALAGADDAAVMIFVPYPGSEETRRLIEERKLVVDDHYYYQSLARSGSTSRSFNREMGTRELMVHQFMLLSVFYGLAFAMHPRRTLGMVERMLAGDGGEETKFEQVVHGGLRKRLRLLRQATRSPARA